MITSLNQRWREGRDSYRPAGELIETRAYEVAPIELDVVAKAFVVQHHYSGTYPAARFRFGLYRAGALEGVAVFSHPSNNKVLSIFPGAPTDSVELGRFVLLDQVAGNGESWFLARCFEHLRKEGLVGIVSFSDPVPRASLDGVVVHQGHVGTIYQASNAVYLGRSKVDSVRLLPDGRSLCNRTLQKIRKRERGWRYAAEQLVARGAAPLGETEDAEAWTATWLPRLTRTIRHPGKHRYAWMLDKKQRRHLPSSLPYPKMVLEPAGSTFQKAA